MNPIDRSSGSRRTEAESRSTEAERLNTEPRSRRTEAEIRDTEARRLSTEAESRNTEAERLSTEAESRNTEAESRNTEAESRSTEVRSRSTEAERLSTESRSLALRPFAKSDCLEAGCDEAGRGCLAGPVFAAAVILPCDFSHPLLNDSKQMSSKQRNLVRNVIERQAVAWAVARAEAEEVDRINILNASILAMHRAIALLSIAPEHLIIDGNRFKPYPKIPHTCFVKGDCRFASIAAASVLAKTHRDAYMEQQALLFPQYEWHTNKGYPTEAHRAAIAKWGVSPLHRKSFHLLPDPLLFCARILFFFCRLAFLVKLRTFVFFFSYRNLTT